MSEPVFELVVDTNDLACEIRVNDVPALRLPGARVSTEFDVNPYVITGENTLSLVVRPRRGAEEFGRHAGAKVAFRVRESKDAKEAATLAALIFEGPGGNVATGFEKSPGYATTTPPVVERLGIRGAQRFELTTPFSPWSWMGAPPIAMTEALRAELYEAYRRVWRLMRARDVGGLVRECALQIADWRQAYYLPSDEAAARLLSLPQTFGDPDVEVEDLRDGHFEVELLGGGRLVQLVDENGQSPLVLRVRGNEKMTGRFVCVFCLTAGGFRIAR